MRRFLVLLVALVAIGCGSDDEGFGGFFGGNNGVPANVNPSIVSTRANFVDISETGQGRNLGDDESVSLSLPFSLKLGTRTFQNVNVCSNGFLDFGQGNATFANVLLPDLSAPDPILAVYRDDLSSPGGNWVFTESRGTAPNRQFIAMWKNAQSPFNTGKGITFEAVLSEAGGLELQYLDTSFNDAAFDAGASATVGLQLGGKGTTWCFQGAPNGVPSNSALAVQF